MKKALIVGISDYTPLLPDVPYASTESGHWRNLLVYRYGFDAANVRELTSPCATLGNIEHRMSWLFARAEAGDQLVFVFVGHGHRLRREGASSLQEALIAYPAGATDLNHVALFDHALATLLARASVSDEARLTFIFDCCHGGGIDFREQPTFGDRFAQALDFARQGSMANVVLVGARGRRNVTPIPVVIGAVGADRSTGGDDGETRSVFSSLALQQLEQNPTLTYRELVEAITPAMKAKKQEPCLVGDEARTRERFLE